MAIFHHFPWCSTSLAPWKSGKNHHEITINWLIGFLITDCDHPQYQPLGVLNIAQLLVVSVPGSLSSATNPIQKSCVVSWAEMEMSDHRGVKGYTMLQHATACYMSHSSAALELCLNLHLWKAHVPPWTRASSVAPLEWNNSWGSRPCRRSAFASWVPISRRSLWVPTSFAPTNQPEDTTLPGVWSMSQFMDCDHAHIFLWIFCG